MVAHWRLPEISRRRTSAHGRRQTLREEVLGSPDLELSVDRGPRSYLVDAAAGLYEGRTQRDDHDPEGEAASRAVCAHWGTRGGLLLESEARK